MMRQGTMRARVSPVGEEIAHVSIEQRSKENTARASDAIAQGISKRGL